MTRQRKKQKRKRKNALTMANEVRPVYGPAPPPDSYDTTSPLLLYTSHRSQKRASVFKRAALASKRKVCARHFENTALLRFNRIFSSPFL